MRSLTKSSLVAAVSAALLLAASSTAFAGGSSNSPTPAQEKQALSNSDSWGVPVGWSPSSSPSGGKTTPAAALKAVAAANGSSSGSSDTPDTIIGGGGGGYPASASVKANQRAQTTSYYCGPASVVEALGVRNVNITQAIAASLLGTTTDGTAWYGATSSLHPTGYPVPDILNRETKSTFYDPQNVDYTPTSQQIQFYKADLVVDVSDGYPLIGNALEVPRGPHLVGHPSGDTIYHYFEIRGYTGTGGTTDYEDSVHNASSISWSAGVPAYSALSSTTIANIVGGRGYVW